MNELAWWIGWTVPDDLPESHMVERWPEGMRGWHTGSGLAYQTWVGIVFADSEREAWRKVINCYTESSHRIGQRFDVTEKTDDAVSDRFVGATEWLTQQRAIRRAVTE